MHDHIGSLKAGGHLKSKLNILENSKIRQLLSKGKQLRILNKDPLSELLSRDNVIFTLQRGWGWDGDDQGNIPDRVRPGLPSG